MTASFDATATRLLERLAERMESALADAAEVDYEGGILNVTLEEDLPGQAAATGDYMLAELQKLQKRFPDHMLAARGLGLLIGVEFVDTEFGYAVAAGLFKRGVLVAGTLLNARTLRFEPALNIPRALVDEVVEKLEETLEDLRD